MRYAETKWNAKLQRKIMRESVHLMNLILWTCMFFGLKFLCSRNFLFRTSCSYAQDIIRYRLGKLQNSLVLNPSASLLGTSLCY